MADDKQVDFQDGVTAVTEAWLDRMQEVQQGLAWNINLNISGTSVVLPAGSLENVASLVIKGKMRYVNSPLSINFTGSPAGTYGIWANTTATDSAPTFTLQSVLGTSAPSGVTYTRKLATVVWSGSALSNLILLAPYVKHGQMHVLGGSDPLPGGSVGTGQIADDSVTNAKIADNSVEGLHFVDSYLQKVIFLGGMTAADDVTWLPDPANNSGSVGLPYRGQVLVATGSYESFGKRNFLGNAYHANGPIRYLSINFPNIVGLKRQIRMRYKMVYGGQAGVTAANITVRDTLYNALNFGITISSNFTSIQSLSGVGSWIDADTAGFGTSGSVGAPEFRDSWIQYQGNFGGAPAAWVAEQIIFEGRYSRA